MQRKVIFIQAVIFLVLLSTSVFAYENEAGTVGLYKYEAGILGFWISYDSGTSFIELLPPQDNAVTVDIAQGDDLNTTVSTFLDQPIPEGTVTHVKVRSTQWTTVNGWLYNEGDGLYYYTDPSVALTQTNSSATQPTEAMCQDIKMTDTGDADLPDYFDEVVLVPGGITAVEGENVDVSIVFDLDIQLALTPYQMPDESVTQLIAPSADESAQPTIVQVE